MRGIVGQAQPKQDAAARGHQSEQYEDEGGSLRHRRRAAAKLPVPLARGSHRSPTAHTGTPKLLVREALTRSSELKQDDGRNRAEPTQSTEGSDACTCRLPPYGTHVAIVAVRRDLISCQRRVGHRTARMPALAGVL